MQNSQHLRPGMLLKFAIGDHGLTTVNGKPITADIQYKGLANRFRAGADSVSKVYLISLQF
jgi:snurportin-1